MVKTRIITVTVITRRTLITIEIKKKTKKHISLKTHNYTLNPKDMAWREP